MSKVMSEVVSKVVSEVVPKVVPKVLISEVDFGGDQTGVTKLALQWDSFENQVWSHHFGHHLEPHNPPESLAAPRGHSQVVFPDSFPTWFASESSIANSNGQ